MFKSFYETFLREEGYFNEAKGANFKRGYKIHYITEEEANHRARLKYVLGGTDFAEVQIPENYDPTVEQFIDMIGSSLIEKAMDKLIRMDEDWYYMGITFTVYARPEILQYYYYGNQNKGLEQDILDKYKEFCRLIGYKYPDGKFKVKKAIEVANKAHRIRNIK